jgi:hypothetical protein
VADPRSDRRFSPEHGVAAECGIPIRYLQKLFAKRSTTCNHYISLIRLEHASRPLQRRSLWRVAVPDQPLQPFTISGAKRICSIVLVGEDLQVRTDLRILCQ